MPLVVKTELKPISRKVSYDKLIGRTVSNDMLSAFSIVRPPLTPNILAFDPLPQSGLSGNDSIFIPEYRIN